MARMCRKAESLIRLKVSLRGIKPPIWRRLVVPGSMTLGDLHAAVQAVMGWEDSHLHAFKIGGQRYGEPGFVDDVADEEDMTLDGVRGSGITRFTYTYDFGDNWEHAITIENEDEAPVEGRRYPACVAGKRNGPPEDCGGCWGYMELLDALADPAAYKDNEWLEMFGEGFDPNDFSLEACDARLEARFHRQ